MSVTSCGEWYSLPGRLSFVRRLSRPFTRDVTEWTRYDHPHQEASSRSSRRWIGNFISSYLLVVFSHYRSNAISLHADSPATETSNRLRAFDSPAVEFIAKTHSEQRIRRARIGRRSAGRYTVVHRDEVRPTSKPLSVWSDALGPTWQLIKAEHRQGFEPFAKL